MRSAIGGACRRRPSTMRAGLILGVAALAVAVSSYPVVFFGRSYTAPQFFGVPLIYPAPPFIPGGARGAPNEYVRYSDVGAFPWAFRPWSVVEAHAILDDGEFPLWNRYNSSGIPLLGQGISQIADPLHWIAVLGRGSALAWDAKFLLAKTLFVVANVLIAMRCVRSLPLSLAVGASSAFIGMFLFRINHAGYFTACYAPWLLLAWIWLVTSFNRWYGMASVALTVLSTIAILGSGAIKEGAVIVLCVDAAGLSMLLLSRMPSSEKLRRLGVAALAGVATLQLSFPLWSSFLATVRGTFTLSDLPNAHVLPISLVGGLLDDGLYAQIALQRFPSLNLLLGIGILWSFVAFRRFGGDPIYIGLLIGAAFPALLAYGLIPPSLIARMPFIGHIEHIHDAFCGAIIVFGVPLAAYGLRAMTEFGDASLWRRQHRVAATLLVVLALIAVLVPVDPVPIGVGAPLPDRQDEYLWAFLAVLLVAAVCAAPLTRAVARGNAYKGLALAALIVCLFVIHVRDAMHLETGVDEVDLYALNPGPRPDFSVPSSALATLPNGAGDPYRIVGLGLTLLPGYSAALGLESVGGPDPLIPATYRKLLLALHFPIEWGWRLQLAAPDLARLSGALDFLNVRYIADARGAVAMLPSLTTANRSDLDIVSRPTAWPRAYFTDDLRTFASLDELARLIGHSDGEPFAAVTASGAAQVSTLLAPGKDTPRTVAAHDYRLTSRSTRFEVEAPGPGIVVLGEQYFDGFKAFVNGAEQPILRVNAVFKGVAVSHPGVYVVEFVFDPGYWQATPSMVAIGGIVLLVALAAVHRWAPRAAEAGPDGDDVTYSPHNSGR